MLFVLDNNDDDDDDGNPEVVTKSHQMTSLLFVMHSDGSKCVAYGKGHSRSSFYST